MEEHITKAQLLAKIRTKHGELDNLLVSLNEEHMTTPGVGGGWSVKDILIHLTAWQQRAIAGLHATAQGGVPNVTPVHNEEEMNAFNDRFYEEHKAQSLKEVLNNFQTTHLQMLQAIEALTDEELNDPQHSAWLGGEPIWKNVAGNTYEHIEEHIEPIQALAAKNQPEQQKDK